MKCARCKTEIKNHLWIVKDVVYCSPACERGKGPNIFKNLWDERRGTWKFSTK